ncbi:MAG: YafY family transcriptional regulator [Clostridia bacterium]|nr:YafY family transcriptional regulator [Clostridia bacterium]
MQVSRLFRMLYILLERERVTATALARELEVSVRTVYRDAQALSEAGVPICSEQGRNGGFAILPTYKLSKSLLTEGEQQSILSSLSAAAQSGAQDKALLDKLSAFFGAGIRDWVQIDFADWSGQHDQDIAVFRHAILENRVLAFDYFSESGEKTRRTVCPFRLWFKGQAWYLRAYCLTRNAVRTFKLSRIHQPAIVPGEFPQAALSARQSGVLSTDWPEPPYIRLLMRADSCMAYRIYDDFAHESITQQEDGSFLIDAKFPPGAWLQSIILGYGAHAEVLEPKELRKAVIRETEKILAKYKP